MNFKVYIEKDKFEALRDCYYKLTGWNPITGWPLRSKLEDLYITDIADELERLNKLG